MEMRPLAGQHGDAPRVARSRSAAHMSTFLVPRPCGAPKAGVGAALDGAGRAARKPEEWFRASRSARAIRFFVAMTLSLHRAQPPSRRITDRALQETKGCLRLPLHSCVACPVTRGLPIAAGARGRLGGRLSRTGGF